MNRILPIILLASSVWVVLGFIKPQFADMEVTKGLIEERKQTLNDAERVIERRDQIMTEYASISDEQVARLKMLLPDRADGVRGALELFVLAHAYGLMMTDISVSSQAPATKKTPFTQATADPATVGADGYPIQTYKSAPINVTFKGTYQSLLAFLTDLESSLRLADLSGLVIDARANKDDSEEYTYVLTLDFYEYVI